MDADRPVLVYDADCGFCVRWVQRWREATGPTIDYEASHAVGERYEHVTADDFAQAVYLFEPGGRTSRGAEAVVRALAAAPRAMSGVPLFIYTRLPGARPVLDTVYNLIATNRLRISRVENAIAGPDVGPSTWLRSRRVFTFALGLVALIAILSARTQILALAGSGGILPVADRLADGGSWTTTPTWLWIDASDAALTLLSTIGIACALLLMADVVPALAALAFGSVYLSLISASPDFFSYQWDALLIETMFVATLYAPWHIVTRRSPREPLRVARWLVWFVLFRLMFESGVVKLTSQDPTWSGLTALQHHYVTQPLPHIVSWFMHKAPAFVHQAGVVLTFFAELALPFTILAPRRIRHLGALGMIALQVVIFATGNFGWFNLLTIALCLSLFDDQWWRRTPRDDNAAARPIGSCGLEAAELPSYRERRPALFVQRATVLLAALVIVPIGTVQLIDLKWPQPWPTSEQYEKGLVKTLLDDGPSPSVRIVNAHLWPFRVVNSYGLFATMTTTRPSIRVDVAYGGDEWRTVRFAHRPGDPAAAPRWSQPHMPRLDWQLWFEALHWERTGTRFPYEPSAWFIGFLDSLAEARPAVLAQLRSPTGDDGRPHAIRIRLEHARFTTAAERAESGDWWVFEGSSRWITPFER